MSSANSRFLGTNLRALSGTRTTQLWSRCHLPSISFLCSFLLLVLERGPPGGCPTTPAHPGSGTAEEGSGRPRRGGEEAGCSPRVKFTGIVGASLPGGGGHRLVSILPGPASGKPRPRAGRPRGKLVPAGAAGSHPPRGLQTASESREGLEFFL